MSRHTPPKGRPADKGPEGFVSVDVESGVSTFTGEGFCRVVAVGEHGTTLVGQLDPAAVRGMALAWLTVADVAEQDAGVMKLFADQPETGATMIQMLRQARERET